MEQQNQKSKLKAIVVAVCLSLVATQAMAQQQGQQEPGQQPRPGQQQPGAPDRPQSDQLERPERSGQLQQQQQQRQYGQKESEDQKQFTTEKFIKEAAQGNLLEMKLGQLASEKSENAEVKEFAEKLVQDHRKAEQELKGLAQKYNVQLDQQLDSKHQQHLQKFQSLSGEEFDKEFATFAIKEHVKTLNNYQKAAIHSKEQAVQRYIRQTVPGLKEHLQMAQNMAKSVGIDESTITSLMRETDAVGTPGAEVEIEAGKGSQQQQQQQEQLRQQQPDRESQPKQQTEEEPKVEIEIDEKVKVIEEPK